MTAPTCEWCGGERRPTQKDSCSAKCRAGRFRWLRDEHSGTGEPPAAPPWPGSPLHGRRGELKPPPPPTARSGNNARSGTMLSYRKAVAAVRAALPSWAADDAERALTEALAPAQRRKVEARSEVAP